MGLRHFIDLRLASTISRYGVSIQSNLFRASSAITLLLSVAALRSRRRANHNLVEWSRRRLSLVGAVVLSFFSTSYFSSLTHGLPAWVHALVLHCLPAKALCNHRKPVNESTTGILIRNAIRRLLVPRVRHSVFAV